MEDTDEQLSQFVAVTGADEATARFHLEASGWSLEGAVEMFFSGALGGDHAAPAAGAGGHVDDEELARRLQREADAGPAEEQVRAPIPVRTERLYGDVPHRPPIPARRVDPVPHNVVDAFRDLSGEGEGASGSGAGGGAHLARMFEPPRELLFAGGLDEAKQAALEQSRWLLVNVQSMNQFASHQLNRDTWRNEMVKSLVENNFVFFQVYEEVEEGQKLLSYYKVFELPATLVVDPVTGAPMRQWTGFLNAERMAEELMPFLDHDIHDPAAARLAAGMKRKKSSKDVSRQGSLPAMTEDEELQRALEMSLMGGNGGGGGAGGASGSGGAAGPSLSDEEDERAVLAALAAQQAQQREEEDARAAAAAAAAAATASPAAVAAEAAARLPPEPEGAGGCRIAVRFPDGRRGQRRFPRSAPLGAVRDFCLTQVEEAAGGRPFVLAENLPGAPPLADATQSLEEAKVADAMLVMRWAD